MTRLAAVALSLVAASASAADIGSPIPMPAELRPDDAQIARVAEAWRAAGLDVRTQVVTPHNGRADVVAGGYAWEVELAPHYHEGVGQACLYAADLSLGGGLVLIAGPGEERHVERARISARRAGVLLLVAEPDGEVPAPPDANRPKAAASAKAAAVPHVQVAVLGAEWCGPCRKLHPECEGLTGVGFVDIDKEPEKARSLWAGADADLTDGGLPNVLPALVVIVDGEPTKWLTPKPNKTVRRSDLEWYLHNP